MKNYKIGFSIKGFIAFLLIMIPNIIWMICPPTNDILAKNSSKFDAINILMSVSQFIMIAAMILLSSKIFTSRKSNKFYLVGCIICICVYYFSWCCYYNGSVTPIMLLGMAVFPCSYFILFALWQKNYIALIPTIVFSALHISITFVNFVM